MKFLFHKIAGAGIRYTGDGSDRVVQWTTEPRDETEPVYEAEARYVTEDTWPTWELRARPQSADPAAYHDWIEPGWTKVTDPDIARQLNALEDRLVGIPQLPSGQRDRMAKQIETWWHGKADEEIERTVPKAIEYGSHDLIMIGQEMARTAGRTVGDEEAAELGVYFYLLGKLARWTDAVTRGSRVGDDTLFDIGVYVRMAQRIRDAGSWPGVEGN